MVKRTVEEKCGLFIDIGTQLNDILQTSLNTVDKTNLKILCNNLFKQVFASSRDGLALLKHCIKIERMTLFHTFFLFAYGKDLKNPTDFLSFAYPEYFDNK